MNETNMSETTVGINEMETGQTYLINEIPRLLKKISKKEETSGKNASIKLTFHNHSDTGYLVIKHEPIDKDKYKVYNKNKIDNSNIDESASDSVDTDKVGIREMKKGKTYLINEIPRKLEKIDEIEGDLILHFNDNNRPLIRHNMNATDKYKVVNTREIDESPPQTNNSNTTESVPESVVNNTNTTHELEPQNITSEPTLKQKEEIKELLKTVTHAQIQQSKNLEDKIHEYLTSLLKCINSNSEIKTKLIKQSFHENQDLFKYTDRYKFTNALRHMYTFFGKNKNDDLLDKILKSITVVISNDDKDEIIYTHPKTSKKYTQHSGRGIRNYYGIAPKNNLTDSLLSPIYGVYSALSYTGRKLSQVKLSQVFDWREEYFKQLKETVEETYVNNCFINKPSSYGGKRRQIKSKRRLRKTVRRRTTRSYRKK